jgi:uncharacterized protein (UPF0248 family)
MIPIQELLSRIRWDPAFGRGQFIIGYYDRIDEQIIKVPLARIVFETDSHGSFEAIEADGSVHSVPYHRVREVYRDGELIWQRPEPPVAHHR